MIIYSGSINKFNRDVENNIIANKIEELFRKNGYNHNSLAEHRSWQNSLRMMDILLYNDEQINKDLKVAIEYQIPLTSKRVDFLITGLDENYYKNAIIIELKQWDSINKISSKNYVNTFTGGGNRNVVHPCYQAYSYAKTIENFNSSVIKNNIKLHPCAYLHNFSSNKRSDLDNKQYKEATDCAPLFLAEDTLKLRAFIKKFVVFPDNGQILYEMDNGKIKPSLALQDAVSDLLKGNDNFELLDSQKVAYSTILEILEKSFTDNKKHTIIVQGGPGTGKSVIAVKLLSTILKMGLSVNYITKNSAPRYTFAKNLIQSNYKKCYVRNLFRGSGSFVDTAKNTFDCLLCDEAHRLNAKSGIFSNKGENQIKEIINASRVSVFFIDENQIVTTKDIGTIDEIVKWAKLLGSEVYQSEDINLESQFRCNGSDGYLAFLDNLLGIKKTANEFWQDDFDYDVKIFDSALSMKKALEKKNINNKARMIAGYCYDWKSKNNKDAYDIVFDDGFRAKWNFTTNEWATDIDSFNQVGCIHSSQGLEFDYVGVIIGEDLIYENGMVQTDYTKRSKNDRSLFGIKKTRNYKLADKIIRNTYRTLLSRGQKGCYIYCENKQLSNHLKEVFRKQKKVN